MDVFSRTPTRIEQAMGILILSDLHREARCDASSQAQDLRHSVQPRLEESCTDLIVLAGDTDVGARAAADRASLPDRLRGRHTACGRMVTCLSTNPL